MARKREKIEVIETIGATMTVEVQILGHKIKLTKQQAETLREKLVALVGRGSATFTWNSEPSQWVYTTTTTPKA